ncbi:MULTISPECIES: hypothetical protein [unclassified Mesorhizobium]|uniref:hypothetical protein n=1 Tax=unclassified Mesorhizobium TaxID=325217 RepID=UPI00333A403F
MPDESQPVEFSISPQDIEKLKMAQGAIVTVKGYVRDGKLTITGVQQEFKSPFAHNWPPGPPG